MGQVWLAVRADGLYERRVALKLLRPGPGRCRPACALHPRTADPGAPRPCAYRAPARRRHQPGRPALSRARLRATASRSPTTRSTCARRCATRLHLFAQVCAAVSHAHANLVVHRDLKPSNILVTSAGEVCLLDFGIAKLLDQDATQAVEITRTGSRTFTLHYAAPEQLRGELVTTMTDVYALGVVLYELLTDTQAVRTHAPDRRGLGGGDPRRRTAAALAIAARKARETGVAARHSARARTLAGDLDNIVLKALGKLPEQRYASVEALAQDLRRYLDGQPVQARAQSLGYRARKYLRRHALGLATGVGVTAACWRSRWRSCPGRRAGGQRGHARAGDAGLRGRAVRELRQCRRRRRARRARAARCRRRAAPIPNWPRSRRHAPNCSG